MPSPGDADVNAPSVRHRAAAPVRLRPSSGPIKIDPLKAAALRLPPDDEDEPEALEEDGETEVAATPEPVVAPASAPAPAPLQPARPKAIAIPVPQLPVDQASILNNMLCREINSPSASTEPPDVSLVVMREVVRAALEGRDLSHLEDKIKAVSAMIQDKHELLNAIINGPHAFHEKHEWVQLRAKSHQQLRASAGRGDLNTAELIVSCNLANEMINQINKEIKDSQAADPITVVHRIENNRKRAAEEDAETYEGTTPQGREIIRKQVYAVRKQLRKRQRQAAEAPSS